MACSNGKFDVSRLLIDRGSDINMHQFPGRERPYFYYTRHHIMDTLKLHALLLLLDSGSDVNAREERVGLMTLLHKATRNDMDHGADGNGQKRSPYGLP
jgi:hypothetical protein